MTQVTGAASDIDEAILNMCNNFSLNDKADGYGIKFDTDELNVDNQDDNSDKSEQIWRPQFYGNTREQNFTVNIFEDVLDEVEKDPSKSNKSLFELMKDKMTDICDEGKVKKRVIKEGYGDVVAEGSYMKFDYIGYLDNNVDVFDSTLNNPKCYSAVSRQDSLLYGLQLALATMKIAETSQFLIHYDYAFGKNGIPGVVPVQSNVLFEVHLYSFEDLATVTDAYFLDREDRFKFKNVIKVAKNLNVVAKEMFKTDARSAALKYKRAIDLLEECIMENEEEEQQRDEILVKQLIDIAICYNRVKWPKKACLACNRAYRLIRTRHKLPAKLLYQNAKALLEIGDYQQAYDRIKKAGENLPNNEEIGNMKRLIEILIQEKDEIAARANKLTLDEDNIAFKENATDNREEDIVDPTIFSEINRICLHLIDDHLKQSEKIDGRFESKQIALLSKYVQQYNLQFVEEDDIFFIKKF